MKSKRESREDYIEDLYQEVVDDPMYAPDVFQSRTDFTEGWDSAEERLEQIIKQLQKEDITSTVYILREVLKRMKE